MSIKEEQVRRSKIFWELERTNKEIADFDKEHPISSHISHCDSIDQHNRLLKRRELEEELYIDWD